MRLENQVCTLEQAKRLKELGIAQNSLFVWTSDGQPKHYLRQGEHTCEDDYSAYTVAELGVMLPEYTESHKSSADTFYCALLQCDDLKDWFSIEVTEAKARAAYLIYLLENGHTTAEEVNQRLKIFDK